MAFALDGVGESNDILAQSREEIKCIVSEVSRLRYTFWAACLWPIDDRCKWTKALNKVTEKVRGMYYFSNALCTHRMFTYLEAGIIPLEIRKIDSSRPTYLKHFRRNTLVAFRGCKGTTRQDSKASLWSEKLRVRKGVEWQACLHGGIVKSHQQASPETL